MNVRAIIEDESARDFLLRQIRLGKMSSLWVPFVDEHNPNEFITFKRRLWDSDVIVAFWLRLTNPNHLTNPNYTGDWVAVTGLYRNLAAFAERSSVRVYSYYYSSLTRLAAEAAAKRDAMCFAREHAAALRGSR